MSRTLSTHVLRHGQSRLRGGFRFKPARALRPYLTEIRGERKRRLDAGIAERLEGMLQFMTDRGDQLAPGGSAGVHMDAKEAVGARQLHGHVETRSHALAARALEDVDQAVSGRDRLDQTTEGGRPLHALS